MSTNSISDNDVRSSRPWWREPEVAVLIVLVVVAYFVRIGDVTLRGEETRRAQVAFEMVQSGDWIVPREQGEPYQSRPPLQNWLIAASCLICGSWEPWVLRLHSVIAMLFTTLLVYGYARTCLSRAGALAAAVAFATIGELFEMGCQAETEALFIALVSSSLLIWHWGQVKSWPLSRTWVLGYVLAALGFLCKGPQAPVYFLTSVTAYLALTGGWRQLFSRAHLTGALAGVAIVLAWMVPCALATSWPMVKGMILKNTSDRLVHWHTLAVAGHMIRFPAEVFGCTMPWSFFLLAFASRDLRRSLGIARPHALFLGLCLALAFPTCWIPPGGSTRYFTPLYPCLAVLVGMVLEACMKSSLPAWVRQGWRWYVQFLTGAMVVLGLGVVLAALTLRGHAQFSPWAERLPVALGFAAGFFVLAGITWTSRNALRSEDSASRLTSLASVRTVVLALACFMVLACTGLMTSIRVRRAEDQAGLMARLKEQLPPGHHLVSFGHIDSTFAFFYRRPIKPLPMPSSAGDLPEEDNLLFCFGAGRDWRPELPFDWDQLAVVSMDRNHHAIPESAVVVGRLKRSPKK